VLSNHQKQHTKTHFQKTTSSADSITENITTVTFSPGVLYTLPNEEYREALKTSLGPSDTLYQWLDRKDQGGNAYLIPSIEGITDATKMSATTN
jgi:hypothetical protein